MHDAEPVLLLLLFLAVAVLALQSWTLSRARRLVRSNEQAARREAERTEAARLRGVRAGEGERDAAGMLRRAGYAVIERQAVGSWTVRADGEPVTFGLRADYLVGRGARRYIAEVKTGRLAPRLAHGPTRRQLLEYSAAFDVDGVLLVDADAGTVVEVAVDFRPGDVRRQPWPSSALVAVVCAALGLAAGWTLGQRASADGARRTPTSVAR